MIRNKPAACMRKQSLCWSDCIPILGTAWKYAFSTLVSFLRSREKVTNITLLDEVKRINGEVQAPDIPHHLKHI